MLMGASASCSSSNSCSSSIELSPSRRNNFCSSTLRHIVSVIVIYSTYKLVLDSCSAGASAAPKNDLVVRYKCDRIDWEGIELV